MMDVSPRGFGPAHRLCVRIMRSIAFRPAALLLVAMIASPLTGIACDCDSAPNTPTQVVGANFVTLGASKSYANACGGATYQLAVEVRLVTEAFTGVPTHIGPGAFELGAAPFPGVVINLGTLPAGEYKWQYNQQVMDGGCGPGLTVCWSSCQSPIAFQNSGLTFSVGCAEATTFTQSDASNGFHPTASELSFFIADDFPIGTGGGKVTSVEVMAALFGGSAGPGGTGDVGDITVDIYDDNAGIPGAIVHTQT
ncbi:MAG: hypothetical protein R3330_02210, partial [Saprospiraceae bacterium]|nr:hypothetical protein [Saprospiraceae bacterium]